MAGLDLVAIVETIRNALSGLSTPLVMGLVALFLVMRSMLMPTLSSMRRLKEKRKSSR